jgi:hypothetical protein
MPSMRPFLQSAHRQTVLGHLERRPAARMRVAKIAHLGHRHAGIVGDDHGAGLRESPFRSSTTSAFLALRSTLLSLQPVRVTIRGAAL